MINQHPQNTTGYAAPSTVTEEDDGSVLPGNPFNRIPNRKAAITVPKPQGWSDVINNGPWSDEEHDRFVEALRMFPHGPWRLVAEYVGTRTVRQVQTHQQKINEKARRHLRGLHKTRKDRPSSEPIGSVSIVSSDEEEEGTLDYDSDSGVIFEPIDLSPTWAATRMTQEELAEATASRLDVEGMEDVLSLLFEQQMSP